MRALLVFSSSELGGAERSLSRMAFASVDVQYRLATLQGEGPWSTWVRTQGQEPLVFGRGRSTGLKATLRSVFKVIGYLRQYPVDIVYVCGARASLFFRFLRFLFPGTKLVHGVRWNPDSESRLDRFLRAMERFTHPLVDAWITNSAVAKRTLVNRCKIPGERVSIIYNGLDSMPEETVPLNERPLEILTVANLSPRKGHREYLDVIRAVTQVLPEARFVFVGRDDMCGAVQRACDDAELGQYVRFEGFQADVSPWYRRARLFVLPSLCGEGCPTAILEAMSFAIPCVAFAIDGIPELVEDRRQGALSECGDYSGMATSITEILTDENLASEFGKDGRNRVRLEFSVGNTVRLHSDTFRKILFGTGV